jgi:hypothetical protein
MAGHTYKQYTGFDRSKFAVGVGVYTCRDCGKQTRETGEGESDLEMCKLCFLKAGWENTLSDEGFQHYSNSHGLGVSPREYVQQFRDRKSLEENCRSMLVAVENWMIDNG